MNEQAINRIDEAMSDCAEKRVPAEPIAEFLKGKCGSDADFATLVLQEHKTLEKCFAFVYEQAQKHLNRQNGWISDNDVFAMALDYFALDDEEIERKNAEEKQKQELERQQQEEKRKQKAAEAKEQKDREAMQKRLDKKTSEGQISLFG
jgi:hypothetical protein